MLAAIVMAGCEQIKPPEPDQELRAKLFFQCLDKVPASPLVVGKDSEWADVVNACASTAYYMSIKQGDK